MPFVEYEVRDDRVAVITINRPERRNALGRDVCIGLAEAFTRFRDDASAAVAVLTGTGNTFCAGADVKERSQVPGGFRLGDMPDIHPLVDPFLRPGSKVDPETVPLRKPVIAAVNGYALGGGFFLAQKADLCIAAESASFEITEILRGGAVGWDVGFLEGLSRRAAIELALGARMSAQRAYDVGLINDVVPDDRLLDVAARQAARIASLPPIAVARNLELVRALVPTVPDHLTLRGWEYYNEARDSADAREAFAGYREKRQPNYAGH